MVSKSEIANQIVWEEIGISNDFMFGKVMREPELCRKLLETILQVSIKRIEYPEEQKVIDIAKDSKSVRLDVYVNDDAGTVYDVEMQTTSARDLPKRARYYQGMIDLQLIEKGAYYEELNKSFVIFICTFDPFKLGRHLYTFQNTCKEEPELQLGDGTTKIFLNASGTTDDVSGDLKSFLDYLSGKEVSGNPFVDALDTAVQRARADDEWRREYMTLYMRDRENLEKGRAEGREEGRAEGRVEGRAEMICELYFGGDISAEKAAERLNMTLEEFKKLIQQQIEKA